ncbi:hypothetical protein A4G99_15435 [Haladaptatus sp. R4]|uniref:PKD domain-containing protein n=1 Tax=Haladaptatus sp. R4 TaxID=1679489 RepID=UPI0007B4B377|nr:hypothetical protein A4G99_15435 [Haladaptatus sp. R4]
MKYTRRNVLRDVSALTALGIGASGLAAAADCSGYPDWRSDTSYTDGDRVVYDGALWEAQWWTQANEPEPSDSVWVKVGPCDGSGGGNAAPTASFSTSSSSVSPGESVSFDANGSSDSDGSIASYDWTFGDGTTASGQTTTHSYGSAGKLHRHADRDRRRRGDRVGQQYRLGWRFGRRRHHKGRRRVRPRTRGRGATSSGIRPARTPTASSCRSSATGRPATA